MNTLSRKSRSVSGSIDDEETGRWKLLCDLLAVHSPSGDEYLAADWLITRLPQLAPGVRITRLGDSLIVQKGTGSEAAVVAHIDTTGFTQSSDEELYPIGGPDPGRNEKLTEITTGCSGQLKVKKRAWALATDGPTTPGSRWVYAPHVRESRLTLASPYLDNRIGVWSAIECLVRCSNVTVAFTAGEEIRGPGAAICSGSLYRDMGVRSVLVADVTWVTKHVRHGAGAAISLRDSSIPPQRFVNKLVLLAEKSGLPFQREIQRHGSSDGDGVRSSGVPLDWCFVGAPIGNPHTSRERIAKSDIYAMAALLVYLVNEIRPDP